MQVLRSKVCCSLCARCVYSVDFVTLTKWSQDTTGPDSVRLSSRRSLSGTKFTALLFFAKKLCVLCGYHCSCEGKNRKERKGKAREERGEAAFSLCPLCKRRGLCDPDQMVTKNTAESQRSRRSRRSLRKNSAYSAVKSTAVPAQCLLFVFRKFTSSW